MTIHSYVNQPVLIYFAIRNKNLKDDGKQRRYLMSSMMCPVKPAFEEFCIPTKKYADVIVPRGADNIVAIDLIVQHIRVNMLFIFYFSENYFAVLRIRMRYFLPIRIRNYLTCRIRIRNYHTSRIRIRNYHWGSGHLKKEKKSSDTNTILNIKFRFQH